MPIASEIDFPKVRTFLESIARNTITAGTRTTTTTAAAAETATTTVTAATKSGSLCLDSPWLL
ncbi:MAG TPA: hypothetical protein VKA40_05975 [Nitrososphaera sp.]|nr:hypothetical protein [Nitrososphaera sp.]